MSKMKAVVIEKSDLHYTVLGTDGSFRKIRSRLLAEVGEEIEIQHNARDFFRGLRLWAGVAAMFLLIFVALLGWNLYQTPTAVAMLSVDINPSVQFTLDAQGHLLKFNTQNEDAKRMLSRVDLTGKPIDEVLEQIVTEAFDQKYLNSEQRWVMVGYSPMSDKTLDQMPKELNETQITSWVTETVEKKGLTPQVAVFPLTPQDRELAQKGDLSLGEYGLWETAQKAGVVTQSDKLKLKDTSERVRLLENPQVQEQIKVAKKEPQTGSPRRSGASKQDSGLTNKPSSLLKIPNGGRDNGKEQEQEETKNWQKDQENNKGKGHGQAQSKESDATKNSVNKGMKRTKEQDNDNVPVLAPIPDPWNTRHQVIPVYKIPERQDKGKMNDKSARDEHQVDNKRS
ncbi:anti-sigma factor domain-containing protein [Desulfosporosinus sp. OT]|uniref:anti-sigma factor domain-containing protein n=1 Tax=Desulfosporosinus sp. OT TaxID=913865 RepID=UPI000223AA8F|nr:anti-sigma factor domain-containing protein [Desulfosporosinus sp. OT]EGW38893.1 hypothetical protein DOT_3068 [Desulfosporosinus sp. OT]